MTAPYILSKLALQDQDEIWDYTVEAFGIDQAVKAIGEIDRHILLLCEGRGIGRVRTDLAPEDHRVWVGPYGYLIIYIPKTNPLFVSRIWHGRQHRPPKLGDHNE